MNCHSTRALLDLHAEGRLTPGKTSAVGRHLESCAACRAVAAPVAAPAGERPAPAGLKARLLAAAKDASARTPAPAPARALSLFPRDAAAVAFAAAALTVIALGLGWKGAPSQSYDAGDELAGGIR